MIVQELIDELNTLNPNAQVFIRDGHHFMREYPIQRVEGEFSKGYDTADDVILVSEDAPARSS